METAFSIQLKRRKRIEEFYREEEEDSSIEYKCIGLQYFMEN
jgi:hypothetical protein